MASASVVEVDDTIVAIGSSTMPATRGVVRLSGPNAMEVTDRMGAGPDQQRGAHQVTTEVDLGSPLGNIPVRVLIWPDRRSYTGQPSVEWHTFGSLPVLSAVVELATRSGARPARPGEFTLRAFLAGRLDLTQAEAVLGVIDADQRESLDHALRQLAGNLSKPLDFLRGQLLDLLADVEAGLDFVDEDIQFVSDADLTERLSAILEVITRTREQLTQRHRQQSEWMVALRGFPNAGKSRLLNALAGREAAIVADLAGTTRDTVSVPLRLGRHEIVLLDTAGIESRDGDSPEVEVSRKAQDQANRAQRSADIRLWCVDHSDANWPARWKQLEAFETSPGTPHFDLAVATKCDVIGASPPQPWIPTSALQQDGLVRLRERLIDSLDELDASESHSVSGTAARCAGSLRDAETAIRAAISYVQGQDGHEYVSSELRLAANALGEVTGAVYTDDILDRVFSRFCIGK